MHTKKTATIQIQKELVTISTFISHFQQINNTLCQDGQQNGLMGRVDEGVDEFFSTKVTKLDSK